jgi:hypothetical protein
MTNEQNLRQDLEALKGSDRELEGLEPVPGKVARERRDVVPIRLAPSELDLISRAAGGNVSAFIRTAAIEKAETLNQEESAAVAEIRDYLTALVKDRCRPEMTDEEVKEVTADFLTLIQSLQIARQGRGMSWIRL